MNLAKRTNISITYVVSEQVDIGIIQPTLVAYCISVVGVHLINLYQLQSRRMSWFVLIYNQLNLFKLVH